MSDTNSTELKTQHVNDNRFMQFCQLAAKGMHCLQVDSIGKPHRSLLKIKMENSSSLILKSSFVKIKLNNQKVKIQNGCKTEGLKKSRKHLPEQLCFSITSEDAEIGIVATDLLQKELWMHGFPLLTVDANYFSQFSGFYLKEVTRRSSVAARKSMALSDKTGDSNDDNPAKHKNKPHKPKIHRKKSSYKNSHKKKARQSRTSKAKPLDRSNYVYMDATEKNNSNSKSRTMKKSLSGMIRSNVTNTFSKLRTKTKTKRKPTTDFDGVRDMIFQMEDNQQSKPITTRSHAALPSVF